MKTLTDLEKILLEALIKAKEHLEYCGYGDKWERECAEAANLPVVIDIAIATATE